jgi:hypothetical protein
MDDASLPNDGCTPEMVWRREEGSGMQILLELREQC